MASFSCFWKCTSRCATVRCPIFRQLLSPRSCSFSAARRRFSRSRKWRVGWAAGSRRRRLISSMRARSRQERRARSSLLKRLSSSRRTSRVRAARPTSSSLHLRCSSDSMMVLVLSVFSSCRRLSISRSSASLSLPFSRRIYSASAARLPSSLSIVFSRTWLFSRLRAYFLSELASSCGSWSGWRTYSVEKPWKKSSGSSWARVILLSLMNFWLRWESSEEREGLVRLEYGEWRVKRGRESEWREGDVCSRSAASLCSRPPNSQFIDLNHFYYQLLHLSSSCLLPCSPALLACPRLSRLLPPGCVIIMGEEVVSSCELVGAAGIAIQMLLGALSFSVLVYKRAIEKPKRAWRIWAMDTSKQAVSQILAHIINVLISMQLSARLDSDACLWYLTTNVLDNTLGVLICVGLLSLIERRLLTPNYSRFCSGNYYTVTYSFEEEQANALPNDADMASNGGSPLLRPLEIASKKTFYTVSYFDWSVQFALWNAIVIFSKSCMFELEVLLSAPLITLTSFLLGWIQPYQTFELVLVIIIVPVIMNAFAFWFQDNFLKQQETPAPIKEDPRTTATVQETLPTPLPAPEPRPDLNEQLL